jgi:S-adenosylmethionine hydrolase
LSSASAAWSSAAAELRPNNYGPVDWSEPPRLDSIAGVRPVITFLTAFGPASTAVCRGVMIGICPQANIIVISQQITRYSIAEGARTLVFALPNMPMGTHVAVVDPGVGTDRLALAIRTARGDVLVGADNGLLVAAAVALGGIDEARSIKNRELMLPVITSSFHGRDVFAPVAAYLAAGVPLQRVGPPVPAERLVRLPEPHTTIHDGVLETEITQVLLFGNVTLAGGAAVLARGRPCGGAPAVVSGRTGRTGSTGWQRLGLHGSRCRSQTPARRPTGCHPPARSRAVASSGPRRTWAVGHDSAARSSPTSRHLPCPTAPTTGTIAPLPIRHYPGALHHVPANEKGTRSRSFIHFPRVLGIS